MYSLTIEITQKCPNNCLFCSSSSNHLSNLEIPGNLVLDFARQAVDFGVHEIALSGGEPLCHVDFNKILDGLSRLSIRPAVYTCGQIFGSQENICSHTSWENIKVGTRLIFNLQSSNKLIHDHLVGMPGAFERTWESLVAAKNFGHLTEVHIVPTKINIDTIFTTVLELSKIGVSQISFLRLVPQGRGKENIQNLDLGKEGEVLLAKIFHEISSFPKGKTKIRFGKPFGSIRNEFTRCNAGDGKLLVKYDGSILPCEAFKDETFSDLILGNINNSSFNEMANAGKNNAPLNRIRSFAKIEETCPAQFFYQKCLNFGVSKNGEDQIEN